VRVLVVDDDPQVRDLLRANVSELGYEAVPAESGAAAVKFLEKSVPDLVLLDLRLPDRDGMEILRGMRADPRFQETPVIVLTGVDDGGTALRCIEEGADDYLFKPFRWEMLRARIDAVVRKRMRHLEKAAEAERVGAYALSLEEAHRRLALLDRAKDEFLGLVTQKLQVPVTGLKAAAEILRQEDLTKAQRAELLNVVEDSAEQISCLVEDANLLSRIRVSGRDALPAVAPHPLSEVLDAAWSSVAVCAAEQGVALGPAPATDAVTPCDPELLARALSSLLTLAIRASKEDSALAVTCRAESGEIRLEIRCPRVEVPESAVPHLLESLSEEVPSFAQADMGLGPALAANILRLLGGAVEVSGGGGGVTMLVRLKGA
jgi:DNA-binding response OmpR family regulator